MSKLLVSTFVAMCLVMLFLSAMALYTWHDRQKQQAYESVLVHGYKCQGSPLWWERRCEPINHWTVPPRETP